MGSTNLAWKKGTISCSWMKRLFSVLMAAVMILLNGIPASLSIHEAVALAAPVDIPALTLTMLSPTHAAAGSAAFTLTATGTGFVAESKIRWDGVDLPTTYLSDTQLTAVVSPAELGKSGVRQVTVANPAPGGVSNSLGFAVDPWKLYFASILQGCANPTFASGYSPDRQPNMHQILADQAWANCIVGAPGVVVAVLDTGVDLDHSALAPNLLPGASCLSLSLNQCTTDIAPDDPNGHGTHVAGIVAATLDGGWVVGVAPRVKILPVQVLDADGNGTSLSAAKGILWAASRARVLNLSFSGPRSNDTLNAAVAQVVAQDNTLIVAAAGNFFIGGNPVQYPAAYPGVVAVAAVDSGNNHASFSNTGNYIDLAAPGVGIFSTYNSGYYTMSGTSQATPHVSGVAALIWSLWPQYTAAQVTSVLESTARDLGSPGWDSTFGWGLVNAAAATSAPLLKAGSSEVSASSSQDNLPPAQEDRQAQIAAGRVLVKFKPALMAASEAQALTSMGVSGIEGEIPEIGVQSLKVAPGQEWAVVDRLRQHPDVEYAEPDYILTAQ
ncbi:MAG: S8 family peptidase [Chloroflexi bacterium]|nr:S8 family peptidase [Chloroflexota bacterium]